VLRLPGCGFYEAETGAAFAAWDFPGPAAAPEVIAARAAVLAASPHNTQPWALHVTAAAVELFADFERHLGTMDGLRRELHIGLGCALENLGVAARALGRTCAVSYLPDAARPNLVARVGLSAATPGADALFQAIAKRHTNRGAYAERAAPQSVLQGFAGLLGDEQHAVQLHLLTSAAERAQFRRETIAATRAIIDDSQMSADSERWYRHSQPEIERYRDGTTLDATGSNLATRVAAKLMSRPSAELANRYWLDATAERQTSGSSFAVLTTTAANTRSDQLQVGRVYQRLQLWATAHGLAMQPLNQLAERQDREQALGLEPRFTRALVGLVATPERRAQMLFRFGYPSAQAFATPRRPLAWVMR
jgi:hypothetical protein